MENPLKRLRAFKPQDLLTLDKKKAILIIVIGLAVISIDCVVFIKLQLRKIKTVAPQVVKLRAEIDTLTKDLANIQDLKRRQNETKQKTGDKKIISEEEVPLFLQEISDIANNNKVKIMQIKPAKEIPAESGAKFNHLIITLDLSCDYHQLGAFLNNLWASRGGIVVQNMKISRDPGNYFSQNVNLVVKTYVKK